jgi:hypothetical protein
MPMVNETAGIMVLALGLQIVTMQQHFARFPRLPVA